MQARITELANAPTERRETHNDSVNNNNVRIEQFPDTLIAARSASSGTAEFRAQETADVNIAALFERN